MKKIDYYFNLTKNLIPISTGNSLHVYNEVYKIGEEKITLFWQINSKSLIPDDIKIEQYKI